MQVLLEKKRFQKGRKEKKPGAKTSFEKTKADASAKFVKNLFNKFGFFGNGHANLNSSVIDIFLEEKFHYRII